MKYEDLPEYLREKWEKVFLINSVPKKRQVISCIYKLKQSVYSPWLYSELYEFERNHKEWSRLCRMYAKAPVIPNPNPKSTLKFTELNPFLNSKQIAQHVRRLYFLNNMIHMLILKYVQRRRLAAMDRRIVGEDDLYTTIRIPTHSLVAVYDFQTQSKYHFHTQTILRIILSSLYYNAYGIPKPSQPKNPYTNLEWTQPQLISIVQQIISNMIKINRVPSKTLLAYHACGYNLKAFAELCKNDLAIQAANDLFKNKDDVDTREIYRETLEDFMDDLRVAFSSSLRQMICERKLPELLQKRWDDLILSIWIYNNIQIFHGNYISYDDLADEFVAMIDDTRMYILNQRTNNLIRQRTQSMAVHTAASIVLAQTLSVEAQAETIPPRLPSANEDTTSVPLNALLSAEGVEITNTLL